MTEREMTETDVPISSERLLAAILKTFGKTEISVDTLLEDYTDCQIAVDQGKEGYVIFELVEGEGVEENV
jgi:hypothetical protein